METVNGKIKRLIENWDPRTARFSAIEIGHFVTLIEHQINATPIGVKKRGDTDNRCFLAEVITPAELVGELGRSPALGKITLPTQVKDYLLQKPEIRQALD